MVACPNLKRLQRDHRCSNFELIGLILYRSYNYKSMLLVVHNWTIEHKPTKPLFRFKYPRWITLDLKNVKALWNCLQITWCKQTFSKSCMGLSIVSDFQNKNVTYITIILMYSDVWKWKDCVKFSLFWFLDYSSILASISSSV